MGVARRGWGVEGGTVPLVCQQFQLVVTDHWNPELKLKNIILQGL